MSKTKMKQQTAETKTLVDKLRPHFPEVEAYRYNSASIRVRIVDARFKGKTEGQREKQVLPLIRQLPEEIQADLTVLLLLEPEEVDTSLMNWEFDNPSPSSL